MKTNSHWFHWSYLTYSLNQRVSKIRYSCLESAWGKKNLKPQKSSCLKSPNLPSVNWSSRLAFFHHKHLTYEHLKLSPLVRETYNSKKENCFLWVFFWKAKTTKCHLYWKSASKHNLPELQRTQISLMNTELKSSPSFFHWYEKVLAFFFFFHFRGDFIFFLFDFFFKVHCNSCEEESKYSCFIPSLLIILYSIVMKIWTYLKQCVLEYYR